MEKKLEQLASVVDYEKQGLKKAGYRHAAALATDAVTNLASMYARSKGGRYALGTNFASQQNVNLANARENVSAARRNYNTLMAELAFRQLIDSTRSSVPQASKPILQAGQTFARKGAEGIISADNNMARWGKMLKRN